MLRSTPLALVLIACSTPAPLATDGGAHADASGPVGDAGPFSLSALPNDTWSFVTVPGAVCGNGSPASIGVNAHAGATELLIVIAGGGACWDAATCFGTATEMATAVHVSEDYTEAMFVTERAPITSSGWDDRTSAANPFRTANIVYVPYCTGDIHGGDAVQTYGPGQVVHHRGAVNMQLYVDAMRSAWPAIATTRVVGFSAGGFGAQMNWGRFADAWPDASLSILADCAPLAELDPARFATWRASWNLYAPADCADCATSFPAYDEYFDARYPTSRFGLVATTRDQVLVGFWGVTDFPTRVSALLSEHLDDNATTRYFVIDSDQHVILGDALTLRSADGTLLIDWVSGWLANDARWHDTAP
jgi:hypothetical protein